MSNIVHAKKNQQAESKGEGEIYMGYASLAVYDAVVAIRGGFEPYGPAISAPTGASVDCAVVEAAYRTLRHYFSSFPALVTSLDGYYSEALSASNLNGCTADAMEGKERASAWQPRTASSPCARGTGD